MQVYLEDDISNFKTRFIQLLCGYLEIEERNLGKVIYANSKTKEAFSFPGLPLYIPTPLCTKEKSLHSDELEIAKAISREAKADGFFYGISNEEKEKTDKFLEHIVKDLKYDVKRLLPELNENLKFSTFINDKYTISICDLFCFSLIISLFRQILLGQSHVGGGVDAYVGHGGLLHLYFITVFKPPQLLQRLAQFQRRLLHPHQRFERLGTESVNTHMLEIRVVLHPLLRLHAAHVRKRLAAEIQGAPSQVAHHLHIIGRH